MKVLKRPLDTHSVIDLTCYRLLLMLHITLIQSLTATRGKANFLYDTYDNNNFVTYDLLVFFFTTMRNFYVTLMLK